MSSLQFEQNVLRSLLSLVRVLRQASLQEIVEPLRCGRLQRRQRRGFAVEDGDHERAPAVGFECFASGQHLEQHEAEREHVGAAGSAWSTFDLFRRQWTAQCRG